MTFSIVARDPTTGDLGIAVQSKFLCVGADVPWAEAHVGAIATQAAANISFGPQGLALMRQGLSAKDTLQQLLSSDPQRETRQIGIIDKNGQTAAFTGAECFAWAGHITGENFSVQGNILTGEDTVKAMARAFEHTQGDLPLKLIAVLQAADQPGKGDARGKQSAALLIVRDKGGYGGYTDRWIDIRVDEHMEPIKELIRIFHIYDMTFLAREDPSHLIPIQDDIARKIRSVLIELHYLPPNADQNNSTWTAGDHKALEAWIGINNFENKWRQEFVIWQSVYNYLVKSKGTPMVNLQLMRH